MRTLQGAVRRVAFAAAMIAALLAKAPAAHASASRKSTWGQILFVGDESEGPHLVIPPPPAPAELYDPASNRFAAHPPMMDQGRDGATATVITAGPNAGKVLIAGGGNSVHGSLSSTQLYDPATDKFSFGPDLSGRRGSHTATAITSGPRAGWILIAGGGGPDIYSSLADGNGTELYDPFTNAFLSGPMTADDRVEATATVIPSGPNAGRILIAGGWEAGVRSLASTAIYDPAANLFAAGPAMRIVREDHTATIIPSGPNAGRILIAGGVGPYVNHKFVPLALTELYDPAANRFLRGPAMKIARSFHTATIITAGPNAGKILFAGGQRGDEVLYSTELYDPAANRFVFGPAMRSARTRHAAIAIVSGPNAGKILIAGGWGGNNAKDYGPLATTELYDPAANLFTPGPSMHGAPGGVAVQLPPAPPR
ncbi:MAG: Kelch repeat-containing protein [Candidatus Binataceae bacterium]